MATTTNMQNIQGQGNGNVFEVLNTSGDDVQVQDPVQVQESKTPPVKKQRVFAEMPEGVVMSKTDDDNFPSLSDAQKKKKPQKSKPSAPASTTRFKVATSYSTTANDQTEELQRGRNEVFRRMKDLEFVAKHRKNTRACKHVLESGKCSYEGCTFSHSAEEHRPSSCIYELDGVDSDGRKMRSTCMKFRGSRDGRRCPHFHPTRETLEEYVKATGYTVPTFPSEKECEELQAKALAKAQAKAQAQASERRKSTPATPAPPARKQERPRQAPVISDEARAGPALSDRSSWAQPRKLEFEAKTPETKTFETKLVFPEAPVPASSEAKRIPVVYVPQDKFLETVMAAAAAGVDIEVKISSD